MRSFIVSLIMTGLMKLAGFILLVVILAQVGIHFIWWQWILLFIAFCLISGYAKMTIKNHLGQII